MTSPTLTAWIDGIGLLGPGLPDWPTARAVLTGETPYSTSPVVAPPPQGLPPAERRRSGMSVKVALAVAQEAITAAQRDARTLSTVFASSGADGDNCHAICDALASTDRHISPTRFHNSVHNAPAGYWGIASGAMAPATVLCAYDGCFSAGLLEALTQTAVDARDTVLIAYDAPYPEPLNAKRPLPAALGIALTLAPQQSAHSLARIQVSLTDVAPDTMTSSELDALRLAIPAARGLPLLRAVALGESAHVILEYLDPLQLSIRIEPCN